MRPVTLTRSRGRQQNAVGVSLFPFLAVLICTMGALILLLLVIARQARLQAAQTTEQRIAEQREDVAIERETAQWRIEQLKDSRRKTESDLADVRQALGHVEDHSRRLREQLARLQETWNRLQRPAAEGDRRQRVEREAELKRLEGQIALARRRLEDARQKAERRRRSYAVIPYRGPHETYRRPIYIECRQDAIILQPEGIVLTEADFEGPMGAGNPLAAALRAAREHLIAHGGYDPKRDGQPYPLLLVRPQGIVAYYIARDAMKSWKSEFGYELIGDDWQLDFRPPDPELAGAVRQAVETARLIKKSLAGTAADRSGSQRRPEFRAAPNRGGIIRDDGTPWESDIDRRADRRTGSAGGSKRADEHRESVSGQPARPGQWQPTVSTPAGESSSTEIESLATSRGANWGLPDLPGGAVPITRPIRVHCYPDRLVIVSEKDVAAGKVIPLGPQVESAIDAFVAAIRQRMDNWGIAAQGMYWRPLLNVHVAPGAGQVFGDFSRLMEDSGLGVEQK